jgi:hypothetical protein
MVAGDTSLARGIVGAYLARGVYAAADVVHAAEELVVFS